ncbi:hypothetical protein [Archangium sp.]|uniref:hypothetical protein n=1 Tax=Archangium sp. TaxID=1872627 RepID=UPI002D599CBA|nr:hypothetical protein [Archangium sp.]HYO54875.1 hypothetical protein [Archangium sp.]
MRGTFGLEPYESLGMLQATRSGVLLFGFVDVMGTDLEAGFKEVLIPQVRQMGGDGAINVRFRQTQHLPAVKVVGAILFFIPLPSSVTMTAEVLTDLPSGICKQPWRVACESLGSWTPLSGFVAEGARHVVHRGGGGSPVRGACEPSLLRLAGAPGGAGAAGLRWLSRARPPWRARPLDASEQGGVRHRAW